MNAMTIIESLLQSVEKVADEALRADMRGRIRETQRDLLAAHTDLRAKEVEIDSLRRKLGALVGKEAAAVTLAYDPPV